MIHPVFVSCEQALKNKTVLYGLLWSVYVTKRS